MNLIVENTSFLSGSLLCPPDKSISHRALILNSMVGGEASVMNLLKSDDVFSTIRVLRHLGVHIEECDGRYHIHSTGWKESMHVLDCGNSGTTMRLMLGALAAHDFCSVFIGDNSLSRRPMKRVLRPLQKEGVQVLGRDCHQYAPVTIFGLRPKFFTYEMPIASAQVKSALMLFGLQGEGVELTGIGTSRDHTERMLAAMGADIQPKEDGLILLPSPLRAIDVSVPGDPSSAAFFIAGGVLCGRDVCIRSVGVNPTRIAFVKALQKMGGNITFHNERMEGGEPVADISAQKSSLRGIEIDPVTIPAQLDELPLLAVVAVFAEGKTTVRGAKELRVKESDRIHAIVTNLRAMGAQVEELPDGFIVQGTGELKGAVLSSFDDHRIAMASAIAGIMAKGMTTITDSDCVSISFPDFAQKLVQLGANCLEKKV